MQTLNDNLGFRGQHIASSPWSGELLLPCRSPCLIPREVAGYGGYEVHEFFHYFHVFMNAVALQTSYPKMMVFLTLIARPNSLQARAKELVRRCKASSV